jgi:hypothetical protein
MRILLTSNYSLDEIEHHCAAGEWPRHHLWGMDALRAAGHEVTILPRCERALLRRLSRAARFQLGDLAKESTVPRLVREQEIDLVVCAEMGSMRAFGLLRGWHLLRTPLVGLLHPGPPSSTPARWSVQGFDRVLCLSEEIRRRVPTARRHTPPGRIRWGPDLGFAGYRAGPGTHIVSNGRTHRDNALLARAASTVGAPLLLDGAEPGGAVARMGPRPMADVLADARRALAVAIPLTRADGCFGITEVNDALALGKPLLMTRNPFVDVDIEAIGCGRWIEVGDGNGWVREIEALLADPQRAQEMGDRGRAHAAQHWNYERFSEELVAAVASLR